VHDCPEEAGAWHLLGVLALRDGDRPAAEGYLWDAALVLTRRAVSSDGNMALAWFSLGAQLLESLGPLCPDPA
jgi:hypothetical protein